MLHQFFTHLRAAKIPVTTREYLTLLEALDKGAVRPEIDHFYSVSRAALVKDERNYDKFDAVFGHVFKGVEALSILFETEDIPAEWLRQAMEKLLTPEEMEALEALSFEDLMETLKNVSKIRRSAMRAARNGSVRAAPRPSAMAGIIRPAYALAASQNTSAGPRSGSNAVIKTLMATASWARAI